jgi:hypothetical protein
LINKNINNLSGINQQLDEYVNNNRRTRRVRNPYSQEAIQFSARGQPLPDSTVRNILKRRGLTDDGIAFIEIGLDVNHDTEVKGINGVPDFISAPSIIYDIKKEISISKPAGVTGNWDASIYFNQSDIVIPYVTQLNNDAVVLYMPLGNDAPTTSPVAVMGPYLGSSAQTTNRRVRNWGGISVAKVASGLSTDPFDEDTDATLDLDNFEPWNIDHDDITNAKRPLGAYRIVSCGFEVVNTSTSLYKGGSVTCWRKEDPIESMELEPYKSSSDATTFIKLSPKTYNILRKPPTLLTSAKAIPGARTWAAEEGCYCQAILYDTTKEPTRISNMANLVTNESELTNMDKLGASLPQYFSPVAEVATSAWSQVVTNPGHLSNLVPGGAYFAGLVPEAQLQLSLRWVIEYFPTTIDVRDLSIAKTSAAYDPEALQLYSQAARILPVGVRVGDNATGDFFKSVIKDFVKPAYSIGKRMTIAAMPGQADQLRQGFKLAESLVSTAKQIAKEAKRKK